MQSTEWLDEVERLDKILHRQGVPAAVRIKATSEIGRILEEAATAKMDRRQLVLEAVARCGNVRKAAAEEDWSHETFYSELRKSNSPVTI